MKKDDYFVIVYNVLNYLYEQLKNGTTTVDCRQLVKDLYIHIKADYWLYIIHSLLDEEYITAKRTEHEYINEDEPTTEIVGAQITPKGIEYLFTHPLIKQTKEV